MLHAVPYFTAETAYAYFKELTYSINSQALPERIDQAMPPPDSEELIDFDLTAVTLGAIKSVLKKWPSNSSQGENGITYHHLKKLPSTHHFLATLFSKILLEDHSAPESW